VSAALAGDAGEHVHPEIVSTQLETATGVCATPAELRAQLTATRAEAAATAARDGLALLAASTHPFGTWREQRLTAAPRYRDMAQRWGALAHRQDICGCHVHVGVPGVGTAVAVMDRARAYLPVLLAVTGSSPFHDGADTGYESWRTVWWSHWPNAGPPEPMGSEQRFREVVVDGLGRRRRAARPALGARHLGRAAAGLLGAHRRPAGGGRRGGEGRGRRGGVTRGPPG
jgi:glutamate---cysteine ligase / carboxylate-amine ligase